MQENKLYQTFLSPNQWYSLQYSRMWEMEVVQNIPAFFDPISGKGALQIFSIKIGMTKKIPKELEEYSFLKENTLEGKMHSFLEKQNVVPDPGSLKVYKKDDVIFLPYEYYIDGRFFMACMFQKKNIFLLALYNCLDFPEETEVSEIGKIIRSITIH